MFSWKAGKRWRIALFFLAVVIGACGQSTTDNKADQAQQAVSTSLVTTAGGISSGESAHALPNDTIPASPQRVGDAEAGRQALINEPIVSCGIPMSALNQLDTKTAYTFSERAGDAAKLPYNLNLVEDEKGVKLAASNCLSCHAAPLFGELVVGLGNEFLDFTNNPSLLVEQSGALVSGENEIAAWEKFANRIAAIAPYMQTQTAGVNPANNLTFALMAHRDPKTMQWHDQPITKPPGTEVPPVSVPPWWRMQKKHAMFWMGEGRGDHASIMMSAAILCADTVSDVAKLDSIAPDIRAFISSIEPPAYPFTINKSLAAEGQQVFESNCSLCHGTYGEQAAYPNRLVPIDIVGTDSSLIDYAFGDGQTYVDWFNQSPFGELAKAEPSRGYVAPPLDGIWATGPFLHNGSVPSIRAVLNSPTRPQRWHHEKTNAESTQQFNQQDLGWNYTDIPDNADLQSLSVEPQWVYDTQRKGYSNTGHLFGDGLSSSERDALIEYLKTL